MKKTETIMIPKDAGTPQNFIIENHASKDVKRIILRRIKIIKKRTTDHTKCGFRKEHRTVDLPMIIVEDTILNIGHDEDI